MLDFTVITKHQVSNCCDNPEKIVAEQEEKRKVFGLVDDDQYLCHFFESRFSNGRTAYYSIDDAIQYLAIKEGYDMVQFSNGNLGFVAYYGSEVNGFEILDREV